MTNNIINNHKNAKYVLMVCYGDDLADAISLEQSINPDNRLFELVTSDYNNAINSNMDVTLSVLPNNVYSIRYNDEKTTSTYFAQRIS